MGRPGSERRHGVKQTRRAGAMRNPKMQPDLGRLSPEALLVHRELQYIRNPSEERLRKLNEARALVADSR